MPDDGSEGQSGPASDAAEALAVAKRAFIEEIEVACRLLGRQPVARRLGITASTLAGWLKGATPNLDRRTKKSNADVRIDLIKLGEKCQMKPIQKLALLYEAVEDARIELARQKGREDPGLGSELELAGTVRVRLQQLSREIARFRRVVLDDWAALGKQILHAEWTAFDPEDGGPVLGSGTGGWPLQPVTDHLDTQELRTILAGVSQIEAHLVQAESDIGSIFLQADGVSLVGDVALLRAVLDWLDRAGDRIPAAVVATRLVLLMAHAAEVVAASPDAGEPPDDRLNPAQWLPACLQRMETMGRKGGLPPRLSDTAISELNLMDEIWREFAWALRARELLADALGDVIDAVQAGRLRPPSRIELWRDALAQWRNTVEHTTVTEAQGDHDSEPAVGVFWRYRRSEGVEFRLTVPAPPDHPLCRERNLPATSLLLGQLSRDPDPWCASHDPGSEFWICDIEVVAVTRDGRWVPVPILVDVLPETFDYPANRDSVSRPVMFGDQAAQALWTVPASNPTLLEGVRWWVVRWRPLREWPRQQLRPLSE